MKVIFPPRPKTRIVPGRLPRYEKTGQWVVQRKFNGTRNTINVTPSGEVRFWHYGEPHKLFKPTPELIRQVLSLNLQPGLEYWLDSELLLSKTKNPHYKGKMVLFDVLQSGRYLMGSPDQMGRLELLAKICGHPTELEPHSGLALQATDGIWMAQTFESDFVDRFNDFLDHDEIEGLVLRKKKSAITSPGATRYEVDWQIRCRKPSKQYQF